MKNRDILIATPAVDVNSKHFSAANDDLVSCVMRRWHAVPETAYFYRADYRQAIDVLPASRF